MAKKKGFFESQAFKVAMKYIYGIGAAIVIGGALFKIMHWPMANEMLILGMGTEVIVFFVSAFEPLHSEVDWSRVYPQLAEDADTEFAFEGEEDSLSPEEALALASQGMKQIEITPDLFESLSMSLTGLKDNVSKLATIEDASIATNEYTSSVRVAAGQVNLLSDGFTNTVSAMSSLASTVGNTTDDAQAYHEQVQNVTKNLSSLNAVYEMELKDAQEHIKSLNKFYGSLGEAMNNMMAVAEDTESYKNEVASLTKNIASLNRVYGGMLSAMGGGSNNG